MKRLCVCVIVLGAVCALWMNAPPALSPGAVPSPYAAPSSWDARPAPPLSAANDALPPATAQSPDSAQIQELLRTVAARKVAYERAMQDALRTREEWKKRWAADTAAVNAELAAAERAIAAETQAKKEAETRLQEIEARLRESIANAKAAAEQDQRERAAQAAAPPPAPQQASDF